MPFDEVETPQDPNSKEAWEILAKNALQEAESLNTLIDEFSNLVDLKIKQEAL
jgi:hypothetical protein